MGAATSRVSREERKHHSLWRHRNLVWGIPAIFIYLIAEIGVANLFVNFVSQPDIANLTHEQAGNYLTFLRSEEHTSELQSLMRISYAVFCLKKKKKKNNTHTIS